MYDSRYFVWRGPDRRSVAYRQFEVAHSSRCVLTAEEHERVIGCAEALRTSDDFPMSGFLDGRRLPTGEWKVEPARAEFSIIWVVEPTGLTCKVRLDALMHKPVIALDVKTCGDARPQAFTRDICNLHCDLQAAFYMEGARRFTGISDGTWIFAAVEAEPPHSAVFYELGPGHELLHNGARKYRQSLELMAKCEAAGTWPSYQFGNVIAPTSRQQSLNRWSGMGQMTSPLGVR